MKKIIESNKINNEDTIVNSKDPATIIKNEENTENRFLKDKSNIMHNQEEYIEDLILEETFMLRYSDPINSIALNDDYLLFGSMIGKVVLYNISAKKTRRIYEMTNESIMGCSLDAKISNKKVFYISIGDESVVTLQEIENENNELELQTYVINNYDTQEHHINNCSQAYTMLWKNKALIIFLYHAKEHDEDISQYATSFYLLTYSIKNIQNELLEEGKITISNYAVPFDFRYNCFLFLEYIQKETRNLRIYYFKGKESNEKLVMSLHKNFGHISFAKILNQNLILIVRNYNLIEIYNIENSAIKVGEFNNQFEINAIDFYEVNNENNNKAENDSLINAKVKDEQVFYIIFIDVNENIFELKFRYNNINNQNKQELEVSIMKNLKDIKGMSEELKNKGLFNLDFPYYIKNSPSYIAVTTDLTCFLIKKQKSL